VGEIFEIVRPIGSLTTPSMLVTFTSCDHFFWGSPRQAESSVTLIRADDLEDLTHCQVRPRGEHDGCPVDADVDQRNFIARSSSRRMKRPILSAAE